MTIRHGAWIRNREGHDPPACVELARAAEAGGWDGVWLSDATNGEDTPYWEPLTLLGAVASATDGLHLGTWVVPLPARDVVAVARGAAVLAELAPGRVHLGLGLGNPAEHEAVGIDREGIGARYDAAVAVLHALLTEGRVSRHDRWFDLEEVMARVPTTPPELLFAVQSDADAPLERAARWGGLVPFVDDDPDALVRMVEGYRAAGGTGAVAAPRVAAWGERWDAMLADLAPAWVIHCEDRDAEALAAGPPAIG